MACGFQDSSIKVFIFDVDQIDVVTSKDLLDKTGGGGGQAKRDAGGPIINTAEGIISFREIKASKEEKKAESEFLLIGHSGPVYGVSISIDEKWLLSCSNDCTSKAIAIGIYYDSSYVVSAR